MADKTASSSTTTPSTTASSTTASSTTTSSTTASSTTTSSTTALSTTALSTTAPSTTAPSTTATASSITAPSTTSSLTTDPSNIGPSTTVPSTAASSITASSTITPLTTTSPMAPSSTPLATATTGPSEEVAGDTQEETDKKRKREETPPLQRSKKTRNGTERREYLKKKPGVKHEATPSVPATDKLSLEVTFRFHVKNLSKVNMVLCSAPCWLHGVPWMIKAGPAILPSGEDKDNEEKYLYMSLFCGGIWGADFWACYGIVELCLLPVNKNQAPHIMRIDCLFHKNYPQAIASRFMLWENVLNSHHGYIEDDAVTFQARLRTTPPYVVNWPNDRLERVPVNTLAMLPPHVTGSKKDKDRNSNIHEDNSNEDNNDGDDDHKNVNKNDDLYAQKNLHMYI